MYNFWMSTQPTVLTKVQLFNNIPNIIDSNYYSQLIHNKIINSQFCIGVFSDEYHLDFSNESKFNELYSILYSYINTSLVQRELQFNLLTQKSRISCAFFNSRNNFNPGKQLSFINDLQYLECVDYGNLDRQELGLIDNEWGGEFRTDYQTPADVFYKGINSVKIDWLTTLNEMINGRYFVSNSYETMIRASDIANIKEKLKNLYNILLLFG